MAPRGTRSQTAGRETRSSALNVKPSSRGGIQKRRSAASRIDTDGDLDMGSSAARRPRASALNDTKTPSRTGARGANTRGASRAAQTMVKHLQDGEGSQLASRISSSANIRTGKPRSNATASLSFLRVHGLNESKASKNSDGGLSDLLAFLERKASSFTSGRQRRHVSIKKVC